MILWLVVAAGTVIRVIAGKMFFAPCLGTNMKAKLGEEESPPEMEGDGHQAA